MDFVRFKKVNSINNMPEDISNGSIYFVQDVQKIYVDFDDERKSYSLAELDINNLVDDIVLNAFTNILTSLNASESSLNPQVDDNYAALLANLKEIGQYSTTVQVQEMIDAVYGSNLTHNYGIVDDGVIKLDDKHDVYKVNLTDNINYSIDTTGISSTADIIAFDLLVENNATNTAVPNFMFRPVTLDTSNYLVYNNKYTLLSIKGFRISGDIKWTLEYRGGWNS